MTIIPQILAVRVGFIDDLPQLRDNKILGITHIIPNSG